MTSVVATRRRELVSLLGGEGGTLAVAPQRLRFSLGVSASDLRIPYEVSADVRQLLRRAAVQLGWMVVVRHRAWLSADDRDALLMSDEASGVPVASSNLGAVGGGADGRATAELAPQLHVALSGGVLSAWLTAGGGGRSLVALVTELIRRAAAEFKQANGQEETPTWVALMLSTTFPSVAAGLLDAHYPPTVAPAARTAAAIGVFLAARLGLDLAVRGTDLPPLVRSRTEAVLGPLPLLSPLGVNTAGVCLYGCELRVGVPELERFAREVGSVDANVDEALARTLGKDKRLALGAEESVALAGLRQRAHLAAREFENPGEEELFDALARLAVAPGALEALLVDDDQPRREWARWAAEIHPSTPAAASALQELAGALHAFSFKKPAKCIGLARDDALREYAQAALGYAADQWLERTLLPARDRLYLRTGNEQEGGPAAEYESGKLYRISTQAEPILRPRSDFPMGHLFVDLKDFTRRTSLLGQAVMADFLRREFYSPILAEAKRHYGGLSHLSDRGGISLNNLLGDAASISGQIDALVNLAVAIRRHLLAYERRLAREVSNEAVAAAEHSVIEAFARRARTGDWAAARETALARARGEGLEAGIFISFGPAPLVITLEDDVFGHAKVAIADRINQSARGTARAPSGRVIFDAMLSSERKRRRDPKLRHAWAVFVDAPLVTSMPPEAEEAARVALEGHRLEEALSALTTPLRAQLETRMGQSFGEGTGDIYNAGAALSQEALWALQDAQREEREFRELTLNPRSLHPDVHQHFFVPPAPVRLVAAYQGPKLMELFRFSGRCLFKGLEQTGEIGVWEILNESPIYEVLVRHHAMEWRTAGSPPDRQGT